MTDRDKFVTLVRVRDMLYFGVQPTLRQSGFAPEVLRDLAKQGFLRLGDKRFGQELDRYVIEDVLPAGESFIVQQKALRSQAQA